MRETIRKLLQDGTNRLNASGINEAGSDCRILMAHALNISKKDLVMIDQMKTPSTDTISNFFSLIELREKSKPISQIIGYRSFWGRNFFINNNVLDPRPETETLIKQALNKDFFTVLDLGTGSGAIIISLLLETSSTVGIATDISSLALEIADKNISIYNLNDRITTVQSDWCGSINQKFDLVISNPPYIDREKTDLYDPCLSQWEPEIALFSGKNGVSAYISIAKKLSSVLKKTGVAIFEIGFDQAAVVSKIFQSEGFITSIVKDLENKDRVLEVTY